MRPEILLLDNGSTQAAATLKLRQLASALSDNCQLKITPVSLAHANKIAVSALNNEPAQIFIEYIAARLEQDQRQFIILPLFFGPSKAVTSLIPQQVEELKQKYGAFDITVADIIYPLPTGESVLTELLQDHIKTCTNDFTQSTDSLVLVDHGSPSPAVTAVRQHICESLQQKLPPAMKLEQAVMERREGRQYDFNGELLENWLEHKARSGTKSAAVILLFFLPGRHAGINGDIEEICQSVMNNHPGFKIQISPLISENQKLIDILAARLQQVLSK